MKIFSWILHNIDLIKQLMALSMLLIDFQDWKSMNWTGSIGLTDAFAWKLSQVVFRNLIQW